jgi:hypothetical protein
MTERSALRRMGSARALLAGAGLDAEAALERARSDELRERLDADCSRPLGESPARFRSIFASCQDAVAAAAATR